MKQAGKDMKAGVDIEGEYLLAKSKNNFDHPSIGPNIKEYQSAYDVIEEFNHRVTSWVDRYQELLTSETKMVERMGDASNVHTDANIANTLKQFCGGQQQLTAIRQSHLAKAVDLIQTPVKKYIADQQPVKVKIEATNKAWIELRYWKKKNNNVSSESEAKIAYDANCEQLLALFEGTKQSNLANWVRIFCDIQQEFYQAAVNVVPKIA